VSFYKLNDLLKIINEFDKRLDQVTSIKDCAIRDYLYKERSNVITLFLDKNNIKVFLERKKISLKCFENLFFVNGESLKLNDIKILREVGVIGCGQEHYIKKINQQQICIVDFETH